MRREPGEMVGTTERVCGGGGGDIAEIPAVAFCCVAVSLASVARSGSVAARAANVEMVARSLAALSSQVASSVNVEPVLSLRNLCHFYTQKRAPPRGMAGGDGLALHGAAPKDGSGDGSHHMRLSGSVAHTLLYTVILPRLAFCPFICRRIIIIARQMDKVVFLHKIYQLPPIRRTLVQAPHRIPFRIKR